MEPGDSRYELPRDLQELVGFEPPTVREIAKWFELELITHEEATKLISKWMHWSEGRG